ELINVDLNATYFLNTNNKEYNFLIKELTGNAEFPEFTNPKVKLIWIATEKSVSSVTFNDETATVLTHARSYSIAVDLGKTDAVIIKGETYNRKLMEKVTLESEDASSSIENENDDESVLEAQQSTTQ
ncbi:5282_t:CDS:2, partial [Gigaspora margarita]